MEKHASGVDRPAELIITRLLDASPAQVYQAWTRPELIKQWFAPQPWKISNVQLDVRAGGTSLIVMDDGQGNEFPNRGVYLEVVENERIVFTDAYTEAWVPSAKPFATIIVTFENVDGRTRYTASAQHWRPEDRAMHENMGFEAGWNQCADQLATLLAREGEAQ
jgi:uncharacterized protein YndB with AHSA1/START domain